MILADIPDHGDDLRAAFIWGANAKRRQMSKGSLAMVAAEGFTFATKINLDTSPKRGRPPDGKAEVAKATGISAPVLAKAFSVREYAPDLVQSVIDGSIQLDAAYETAQARKREAEWRDDGLVMLRKEAPDLAARVVEGEIDLKTGRAQPDDRDNSD